MLGLCARAEERKLPAESNAQTYNLKLFDYTIESGIDMIIRNFQDRSYFEYEEWKKKKVAGDIQKEKEDMDCNNAYKIE